MINRVFTRSDQTPPNYFRALQWAAVTTFISHVDPAFGNVFAIEAVNEPLMDSTETPGYGDCVSISQYF